VNHRVGAVGTVGNFLFRIYSIQEARSEPRDRFPDAFILDDINTDADNHGFMLQAKRVSQITLLHSSALDAIAGVAHAFSTRRAEHTELTLGPTSSDNPMIPINRSRFLAAAGVPGWPVLKLKQIHSNIVQDMTDTWSSNEPLEGDAAVTAVRGAVLGIQTADCVPILIADRESRVVAAVHAGWRGTAARIVQRTIDRIQSQYSIPAAQLTAAIGPHNAVCCYEVGEEVVEAINDPEVFLRRPEWAKPHFDQASANKKQLLEAGVHENQITVSNLCTQCRADLFFSYRREGRHAGRMLSIIGLAP
jgi:YfiH family protein